MRLLFILYCSLWILPVGAQLPSDSIDFEAVKIEFLEQLIKHKVDSIREVLDLNVLKQEVILQKAAADHAEYLKKSGELSHYQDFKLKHTPLDRVLYYGAGPDISVGENVAWNAVDRQTIINRQTGEKKIRFFYTYDRLADNILQGWLESPAHYEVLTKPEFKITALAIAYDQKLKEFYTVQVFAN